MQKYIGCMKNIPPEIRADIVLQYFTELIVNALYEKCCKTRWLYLPFLLSAYCFIEASALSCERY